MLIKVHDGTTTHHGEPLCQTCRHSTIIRGRRTREELVFCTATGFQPVTITFKVTSCTDYVDVREPTYHELLEKAWILRPATKRRAAGFVRASDLGAAEAARLFTDPTEKE